MARSAEEIAGEVAWRYAELIREPDAQPLSAEELQALTGVLQTAGQVPAALEEESCRQRREAVLQRLQQTVEAAAAPVAAAKPKPVAPVSSTPPVAAPSVPRGLIPAWRFYSATALAAALALCVATVPVWHRPPERVRRVPVPRDLEDIRPMTEVRAHELIPRMVRHEQIERQEERDLLWHMLVCPGCYDEYVRLKSQDQVAQVEWSMLEGWSR